MSTEKIKGLTIAIGADTKKFNSELKKVDRDIRLTNKQVDSLQKSLELEWDSKRFVESQKLAQQALSQTNEKAVALKAQMKYLEENGTSIDSEGYKKLETSLINAETEAVLLRKRLEEINDLKIDHIVSGFKKVGSSIESAGKALLPFSAAATAVLASLGTIGLGTVDYADNLKTLADRVNLSASALQKWQYIAMQTDVSNEELQAGLVKTQSAFSSLAKGDSDAATEALLALGFSAEQAAQGMEGNFEQLIQVLSGIQDPLLQAAYANEIFGDRMGSKLVPMLKAGGEGIAQLTREFQQFNVLTEDQIGSLADFDNALNNTKYAFSTIKNEVGVALLPVMESFNTMINEKIIPAVQKLASWFTGLTDSQKNLIITMLTVTAALAPALIIIGKLTSGIGSMIGVVSKLYGLLTSLSLHPVIAIIGVVVGLIALLYTTNEDFRNSINDLFKTLTSALAPILTVIGNLFKQLMEVLNPLIQVIGNYLAQSIRTLMAFIGPLITMVSAILVPALELISPILNVIMFALKPLIAIFGFFGNIMKVVADTIGKWFSGIPKIIDGVFGWIEDKMNGFIDFINVIIREINKLGKYLGITIGELSNVKLQIETSGSVSRQTTTSKPAATSSLPSQAIASAPIINNTTSTVTNDTSTKNVTIAAGAIVIQNYAAEANLDDMVQQIQIRLAEEL